MTDKELSKLKRPELLEVLYIMRKEIDELKNENDLLRSKLEAQAAGQAEAIDKMLNLLSKTAEQTDRLYKKNFPDVRNEYPCNTAHCIPDRNEMEKEKL